MIAVTARPMVVFPSREFFVALQERMNAQTEKYAKWGPVDLRLCLRILPDALYDLEDVYGLRFADYWCEEVTAVCCPPEFGADCTIEGPYSAWKEMFENILERGAADSRHTLNSLINLDFPLRLVAEDQNEADRVYRYMFSLQRFLEEAATLDIEFAG